MSGLVLFWQENKVAVYDCFSHRKKSAGERDSIILAGKQGNRLRLFSHRKKSAGEQASIIFAGKKGNRLRVLPINKERG